MMGCCLAKIWIGKSADADELDNFYLRTERKRVDSAEEEHIWIWPGDLAHPFDEDTLTRDIVDFRAVQDAKLALQRSRCFFSPCVPPHLAGAKGKVKQRQAPCQRKASDGPREQRDERRQFNGLVKVPMAAVTANVVCRLCRER